MWHDHPFGQRKKTTERAVGVRVGGDREGGGVLNKILKRGGRQYRGTLHKKRGGG